MKFKAKLHKDSADAVLSIVASMQRLASECALRLADDRVEIRIKPQGDSEVQVTSTVKKEIFSDYKIHTIDGSSINVEVSLANLVKGLKSTDKSLDSVIKLTNRSGIPCLAVSAETAHGFRVTQNIPIIRFLTEEEMGDYRDPELPSPDITVKLPKPKHIRSVLDRMKHIDKVMTVEATNVGSLTLKVQTEFVTMRTVYRGLEISDVPASSRCKAIVSLKDMLHVMHSNFSQHQHLLMCIVKEKALVVYAALPENLGCITYFLALSEY